jgi:hypothetical protein
MLYNGLYPMNYGKEKGFFQTEGIFSGLITLKNPLQKKSKAIAGLSAISENYVELVGVVVGANRHKKKESHADEMKLVSDHLQEL